VTENALHVERLSARYRRRSVIEDLSLAPIRQGGLTALVGPNAAGKTTLLRAFAGLMKAQGSVRLGETELLGLQPARHASLVTYMPQALPQRVALTVLEATIAAVRASPLGAGAGDVRLLAMQALGRLGIADLAMRSLDELSGGQRQLASLAQAIVRSPRALLLDEPTSALDLAHTHAVMSVVRDLARERDIVAIAVIHDIGLAARFADRVIVLKDGAAIADGPPHEAVTAKVLGVAYGVAARVERCSRGMLTVLVDGPAL
jgi:iron complex transport system ATP-binding protein